MLRSAALSPAFVKSKHKKSITWKAHGGQASTARSNRKCRAGLRVCALLAILAELVADALLRLLRK